MNKYTEETTSNIKSTHKFSKWLGIIIYLVMWAIFFISFWLNIGTAISYPILVFALILPISTFVISLFIGTDNRWGRAKWFMPLFFGFMYILLHNAPYSLAEVIAFNEISMPDIELILSDIDLILPVIICSVVGIIIGTTMKIVTNKKKLP